MAEVSLKLHLSEEERSPSITSITSKDSSQRVKYLQTSELASDMDSEAPTDISIAGSPSVQVCSSGKTGPEDKSSPTTSGPDSDVGSVDDLPVDEEQKSEEKSAKSATSYIGSFFSSAWSKTAKTASEATTGSTAFISSALQKVGGVASKPSPKEEDGKVVAGDTKEGTNGSAAHATTEGQETASVSSSSSSFFSSAWNKMGEITKTVSGTKPDHDDETVETPDDKLAPEHHEDHESQRKESGAGSFLSNFSTMVTKVASDASHVIKDKVGSSVATSMIYEFNKEQEEFIKNKGHDSESGLAPWVGYQDQDAMKQKIFALSDDKRTFIRAPPSGVTFEFDYQSLAPVALAIMKEDPKLDKMRYELVPKVVKEEEFWRNYFYRLNLIKQSFDLKDMESSGDATKKPAVDLSKKTPQRVSESKAVVDDLYQTQVSTEADDEFISEAFQASSKDLDEVNENMKRLGVKSTEEEWEAELEGELNEFEVVGSKDDAGHSSEWENEIQDMLDAEDTK